MESVKDRFLRYISVDTQSQPGTVYGPSTEKQFRLAEMLADELKKMGAEDVRLSEHCIVTATIPSNNGESSPVIGLLAHIDTSPESSGANIRPVITERYDGTPIPMSGSKKLDPADYPSLLRHLGETIISTDGTTLLGADDKAGVAEIMTLAETLLEDGTLKHGPIRIGFTPDEEIGYGVEYFDVKEFGADFAYTVDGGDIGEFNMESFNAAAMEVTVHGVSIHTGSAKGIMKNALLMGMEFQALLPVFMNPASTEGREGFFHLDRMSGNVEKAEMEYIIRDHDKELFEQKKRLAMDAGAYMNKKYGEGTVELKITDTYYNMIEKMDKEVAERAIKAMCNVGIEPSVEPIRGGTDGSRLSFEGLPCPNLCTGGNNFHGPYEYISVEAMKKVVELLVQLVAD